MADDGNSPPESAAAAERAADGRPSLWGISRGRVAMSSRSGDTLVLPETAWGVGTAAGRDLVWWTAEGGLRYRKEGTAVPVPFGPPRPEYGGPEVLWSRDGSRALLTWMEEAGPAHTLLTAAGHDPLRLRSAATTRDGRPVRVTAVQGSDTHLLWHAAAAILAVGRESGSSLIIR